MSKSNPRKAMAALLPLPIGCGTGVTVKPMTLGMWAVPLSAICLLRRQTQRDKSGNMTVFPLSEIEKIDDGEETHS